MKKIILLTALATNFLYANDEGFKDPLFAKQWGIKNSGQVILKNINDLERKEIMGLKGIDINWINTNSFKAHKEETIVAVIDTGFDIEHPDLKDRLWFNKPLCEGVANSRNRSCNGHNFLDNNNSLFDDVGHGTHVAGIIAANQNSIGIAGAADNRVKIMPLKVINSSVNGFTYKNKLITDYIADAVNYAVNNGADVINLSLGWPKLLNSEKVQAAFKNAEEKNVLIVAASGNNNKDLPTYPCSYENVICVGAIDNRGDLTDFTNHGGNVDLVAPGESIISTYPANLESRLLRLKNYEVKRGSSQAAPYVSAVLASLKLFYPDLTNDEVRKILFESGRPLLNKTNSLLEEKRFVRFGMLDMKALFKKAESAESEEETSFVIPQLKESTDIRYKISNREIDFSVDLKNIGNNTFKGEACFSFPSNVIALEENCFSSLEINKNGSVKLALKGQLLDLNVDSHVDLKISVNQKTYVKNLVISRDLTQDDELKSHDLTGATNADTVFTSGSRKLSKVVRVFDKYKLFNAPEYHYLSAKDQTTDNTVVSLITWEKEAFVVKKMQLPKVNKVISIHRQDINRDGKVDYFIYALSAKRDEIDLIFLNQDLTPVYKNQVKFSLPLSSFEGLPVETGEEKFEWLLINSDLFGKMLVPSLYRNYSMPEEDNSKLILDRRLGVDFHQYYFEPYKNSKQEVKLRLRVLDSVNVMKSFEKELGLRGSFDSKNIYLLRPLPQTKEDIASGVIQNLVMLEENGSKQFFITSFNLYKQQAKKLEALETSQDIDQFLIYPIYSLATAEISKQAALTALVNRAEADFLVKDGRFIEAVTELKTDWENPIMALLAVFEGENGYSAFMESRYDVTLLQGDGKKMSLPIYRDSSFPGQTFTESLRFIWPNGRAGIYINSTLIYGDRVYTMLDTRNHGFIRPISLSLNVPTGCAPLDPEAISGKSEYFYTFLCEGSKGEAQLKVLPMSL